MRPSPKVSFALKRAWEPLAFKLLNSFQANSRLAGGCEALGGTVQKLFSST